MSDRARYYEAAARPGEEQHPVDTAVARRLPHKALRRRTRAAGAKLLRALGDRRDLWFGFEDLASRYHTEREEAYYDFGYERGLAAGRAEGLAAVATSGSRARRDLATWVRDITAEANLPSPLKIATLLEVAWALALGLEGGRSTRGRSRGQRKRRTAGQRAAEQDRGARSTSRP